MSTISKKVRAALEKEGFEICSLSTVLNQRSKKMISINHQDPVYYRSFARIDLDAVIHNFRQLKACLKPGVLALATVKANAYGHGSVPVARALEREADYFGVACLEEALELRENGIRTPILIFSYTHPSYYEALIRNEITAAIYNEEEALLLSKKAQEMGLLAKVHLAVDTGMGRIGFFPDEKSADAAHRISSMKGVFLEGIFSHYACADSQDKRDADSQTALFDRFLSLLEKREVKIPIRHICNSAGSMEFDKQYDMCRLGIALYGLYPSDEVSKEKVKLIPAMEVVSHVIHIKTVPQGFQIGYGHTYTAPTEKKIATVSIGYADGFNRCLSGKGYVIIRGKRAPVVGRVCMDQIMVDVSEINGVEIGDHAVVLGQTEGECITAEKIGEMAQSFNYEVVCTFMPRVKRIYYQNGKIVKE